MLSRLIGAGSPAADLKRELDASSRAVKGIAHRVANASTPGFSDALNAAEAANGVAGGDGVDIEREMVALADEQLRFEAASNLLAKVYQQVRSSVREG